MLSSNNKHLNFWSIFLECSGKFSCIQSFQKSSPLSETSWCRRYTVKWRIFPCVLESSSLPALLQSPELSANEVSYCQEIFWLYGAAHIIIRKNACSFLHAIYGQDVSFGSTLKKWPIPSAYIAFKFDLINSKLNAIFLGTSGQNATAFWMET